MSILIDIPFLQTNKMKTIKLKNWKILIIHKDHNKKNKHNILLHNSNH